MDREKQFDLSEKKSFKDFAGCLKNEAGILLTVEEIGEITADAGVEAGMGGLDMKSRQIPVAEGVDDGAE